MTTSIPMSSPGDDHTPLDSAEDILRKYNVVMPDISQKLGHNRIIEKIAEGGMANVYKVWHEELEIVRAVKILKPGFDEESKKRLRTEAKISAHLHHPNIVELYGVNFWNESVPYLEMEFVDGLSLKELIEKEKRLPFTVAIALIQFVCNALHYAHNQVFTLYGKPYEGIVHRDIKPANILLTRSGIPKLADFGIAKPLDISLHTVGQKVMGTFTYLSPEQLNGEPLDRRSDIYSLGIVLYECITGEKAFPQKTIADLIREKLRNQYRKFDSLGIMIPKKLEQIIDKSMQISPDKRYLDAEEFAADLSDVLKKETSDSPERILAHHLTGQIDIPLPKKRKKHLPVLTIFFFAFILALVVVSAILLAEGLKDKREHVREEPFHVSHPNVPVQGREANFGLPLPDTTKKAIATDTHSTAGASAGLNSVPVKPVSQKATSADPLSSGVTACMQQHFSEAIPLLEASLGKTLADSQKNLASICLLEAYIGVNNLKGAQRIVSHGAINDGLYYLLWGKYLYKTEQLSAAIDAFCKAQTTPSAYKKDLRKEATYLWARGLEEAYTAKPNAENKRLAIRAWQQFQNAFCTSADHLGQCKDSEDRLRNLTQ